MVDHTHRQCYISQKLSVSYSLTDLIVDTMLPTDPSPSKQKHVKTQRVLEWINNSNSGAKSDSKVFVKQIPKPTIKRKIRQNENHNHVNPVAKKAKLSSSSKPMSPRKFYLPNVEDETENKVIAVAC